VLLLSLLGPLQLAVAGDAADAGGTNYPLIQLVPSINYSIREEILAAVPCTSKFRKVSKNVL